MLAIAYAMKLNITVFMVTDDGIHNHVIDVNPWREPTRHVVLFLHNEHYESVRLIEDTGVRKCSLMLH